MKFAVIDIGSNSVRLMLRADGTLYKRMNTTRLGEGIAFSGTLKEEAIERTVRAVHDFAQDAVRDGADRIFVFATAAVRTSVNGTEFCERVKNACGLTVDVIGGEREAELGLYGALGNTLEGGMIDIGGASTEVCYRQKGKTVYSVSVPIGAVRLLDRCGEDTALLQAEIDDKLSALQAVPIGKTYAVGGTATTLACLKLKLPEYDGTKVQNCKLSLETVKALCDRLFALTVEERKQMIGMDVRRADTIAGASLLLLRIMEKLHLSEVFVSDSDNLEGYLALKGLL